MKTSNLDKFFSSHKKYNKLIILELVQAIKADLQEQSVSTTREQNAKKLFKKLFGDIEYANVKPCKLHNEPKTKIYEPKLLTERERFVIYNALAFALHRYKKHNFCGMKKSGIKGEELEELMKEFKI